MENKILIAYMPVLSRRYVQFLEKHTGCDLFILGEKAISRFDHLRKDLHRVPSAKMIKAISSLRLVRASIYEDCLDYILDDIRPIIMPDEDVMTEIATTDLKGKDVSFEFVGARYDKKKTLEKKIVTPDWILTDNEFAVGFINYLEARAQKSPDWWRQVGAALIRKGEILLMAINQPTPFLYVLDAMGDPRSNFKKGMYVEFSNALHAEAAIITTAARRGISMDGADLWCTDFCCPPCSRIVAYSGIQSFIFRNGYAMLDGDEIMRSQGIQIIQVK